MGMHVKRPEILAPASSLEVLQTAIHYGADAVYIGGEMYGLRAKAKNFSSQDMKEGIGFAHRHGKKVYVTANITAHERDLAGVEAYFEELKEIVPDALIISDPGVFAIARRVCPEIDVHISTQANNVNSMTFQFWADQGATRVVTARELSLKEIADIRANIPEDLEIETFVHGAMCISYSGRCLLSHYFTGRDANLGACTHPCRWKYHIAEETRPGEYMPVEENERGTFIFNSKDLCMIEHIPELLGAGIDSFKIEGRMKTALYVATIVRAYRQAVDDYLESPEKYQERISYYKEEVAKCTHRQYTTGFFFGATSSETQIYDSSTYINDYVYLGTVETVGEDGVVTLEQKNKFSVGDTIEAMKVSGENVAVRVEAMYNALGEPVESCPHAREQIRMRLSVPLEAGDVMRIRKADLRKGDGVDNLSEEAVLPFLREEYRGRKILSYGEIDSTNEELKRQAGRGGEHGLVALAESQTMGKGRLGRHFYSPGGTGIYMSILFRPTSEMPENSVLVTTAAAVAVCRAIRKTLREEPQIKWVNDIYLRGKKVCGILAEAVTSGSGKLDTIILGIGINYKKPEGGFPGEIQDRAGFLCKDTVRVARGRLVAEILNEMFALYDTLPARTFMDDYRKWSNVIGREVRFTSGDGWTDARALDIDQDGGLRVRLPNGEEQVLRTGEITLRVYEHGRE